MMIFFVRITRNMHGVNKRCGQGDEILTVTGNGTESNHPAIKC
jgi:hypothetical protein